MKKLLVNGDHWRVGKVFALLLSTVYCLLTTACGFQPVYGINRDTPTSVESKLALVNISNIADKEGLDLRNDLIDRFYRYQRPDNPAFDLDVGKLHEHVTKLDVTKTSDATRGQLSLDAHIILTDRVTHLKVLERDVRAITSYNILGSEFATSVTQENARTDAVEDLARQIELQLDLYFKRS